MPVKVGVTVRVDVFDEVLERVEVLVWVPVEELEAVVELEGVLEEVTDEVVVEVALSCSGAPGALAATDEDADASGFPKGLPSATGDRSID